MLSRITGLSRVMQQNRFWPAAIWLVDLLIILVMVLVFFRSHIFTDATFMPMPFDWKPLTHPTLTYTGESLARGEFPLWNPHWFAGFPHFAVPSNAVLYPTTILFGILDWPTAINWVLIGHIYLFAAFSYAVGRDIFRNRLVSLVLALWVAGGSLSIGITFSGHVWGIQTLTWMPLLFLCLRKILYGGHAYWALLASAAFVPMYLGGDVQWLTYALYWLAAYTALELAYCLFVRKQPLPTVLSKGALCLAAIGVGVLLVGIQFLPSRELLAQSIRNDGVTLEYFRNSQLSTRFILNRIVLDRFIFAGRLSAALVLVSLLGRNAHERYTLWLTSAVCILYGLMPDWFYYGVIQHISTLASQRVSMRILSVITFVFFLLAAYGLHRLLETKSDGRLHARRWIEFAIVLAILTPAPYQYEPIFVARNWALAGLALSAAACALTLPKRRVLATAILIGALGAETWTFHASRYKAGEREDWNVAEYFSDFSQARTDDDRVALFYNYLPKFNYNPRFHGSAIGMLTGDRMLYGTHALLLERYARILRDVGGVPIAQTNESGQLQQSRPPMGDWLTESSLRALSLFNVRWMVGLGKPLDFAQNEIRQGTGRFRRTMRARGRRFYENRSALPPAYTVHDLTLCETDEEAIQLLADLSFNYSQRATFTGDFDTALLAPARGPEPVVLREYEANRLAVDVEMTAPGILVFSEMYYPGWKARIDNGDPQNVLCVNTAFRGVFLEEGRHTVELIYRPRSLMLGLAMSALGVCVWLAWAGLLWRRSSRTQASRDPQPQ